MNKDQIIESLLLWNFWEKDIEIGIPRKEYLNQLKKYLATDEIVTLTGVRRSGKSTILLQMLSELLRSKVPKKNTLYVNFEDPRFYGSLKIGLLDDIWHAYKDYLKPDGKIYLVLDEIQKIEGWEHWVRSAYDRKENVKIFVTGSNTELLSSEFSTLLTGRHLEMSVMPLNFKEFLNFKGIEIGSDDLWLLKNKNILKKYLQDYLKIGGFPKIVLTRDELIRMELLSQYFNDILSKDVAERHKIKEVVLLKSSNRNKSRGRVGGLDEYCKLYRAIKLREFGVLLSELR
ncbi:MAG: AAA family ATPase, partial [bacterium]